MNRPHINADGEFQSDKYPSCPPGKVPLSVKDKTAQPLLWAYAQIRRSVDAEFADDLEYALKQNGFVPPEARPLDKLLEAVDWVLEEAAPRHVLPTGPLVDAIYQLASAAKACRTLPPQGAVAAFGIGSEVRVGQQALAEHRGLAGTIVGVREVSVRLATGETRSFYTHQLSEALPKATENADWCACPCGRAGHSREAYGLPPLPVAHTPRSIEAAVVNAVSGALGEPVHIEHAADGTRWIQPGAAPPKNSCADLTEAQLEAAFANIGYDLTCGDCACAFFTGSRGYGCKPGCKTTPRPSEVIVTTGDGT